MIQENHQESETFLSNRSVCQAEKDRAEFDAEWKELGKLIAQDRKLRETLRQRQLERSRDLRCGELDKTNMRAYLRHVLVWFG